MGEAIISRGGGASGGNGGGGIPRLVTEVFTENSVFIVPKAKDQSFSVRIFGGGAGGSCSGDYGTNINTSNAKFNSYGGGSGEMNNAILILKESDSVPIIIGTGGIGEKLNMSAIDASTTSYSACTIKSGGVGGTSSFGTYLSALGGKDSCGGAGGGDPRYNKNNIAIGYQFGGGFCKSNTNSSSSVSGYGGYWGGGGGRIGYTNNKCNYPSKGGVIFYSNKIIDNNNNGFGGNGSYNNGNKIYAENGINTIGLGLDFEGEGLASTYIYGGGGGYGGCGNNSLGGGGGYGANGGSNCGGGGGYGGAGGCGYYEERNIMIGGGGGGYGIGGNVLYKRSNGTYVNSIDGIYGSGGGGGGFLANATYGTYANEVDFTKYKLIQGSNAGNGGNGICIIQYYAVD